MREIDICSLHVAWLEEKLSNPEVSISEFLRQKYIWLHCDEEETEDVKSEFFLDRLEHWKRVDEKYQVLLMEYPDDQQLEQWQASQMLDGVIDAFEMSLVEQYRYLLNVRLLCSYQVMEEYASHHEKLKDTIDQEYERRWRNAENHVTDFEIQELFSDTVEIMQYAGLRYDDDTRYVLAQIGADKDADFSGVSSIPAQQDMRLISCFVVSEMVLGDESETYSDEELNLLLNEVVPVCASSAAAGQNSENPVRAEKLAQCILGEVVSTNLPKILLTSATVLLAAKVTFSLLRLLSSGISIAIGASVLWKMCKDTKNQKAHDLATNTQEQHTKTCNAGENEEMQWENNEKKAEVMNYV